MKRIIALLLLIVSILSLTGCAGMLEDEYLSISEHNYASSTTTPEAVIPEITDYNGIINAITGMIYSYREERTFRFSNYSGNVEDDVSEACAEIMNDSPIGSYATYYVNYTINKYVSYSEADISIIYKKTRDQVAGLKTAHDIDTYEQYLEYAFRYNSDHIALKVSDENITEESTREFLENLYYENPSFAMVWPEMTITCYPAEGKDKIVEVKAEYPYIASLMSAMKTRLRVKVSDYAEECDKESEYETLANMCHILTSNCIYTDSNMTAEKYNMSDSLNSAYGAVITTNASSEGYALAFKMMCDELDIECYVVKGKLNENVHVWNIVKYDGDYFHIDPALHNSWNVLLKSDEEILLDHWWDNSLYPKCERSLFPSATTTPVDAPDTQDAPSDENGGVALAASSEADGLADEIPVREEPVTETGNTAN